MGPPPSAPSGRGPSEVPPRAPMPADVDAPDRVAYGLTFRQLAILAAAAVAGYAAWAPLHTLLPVPVLAAAGVLLALVALLLALGRRDGLPMDAWLLAAIGHQRAPHALSTLDDAQPAPPWVQAPKPRIPVPAPLRLAAESIDADGQIHLTGAPDAAIVAATGVNLALRTADEQAALIEAWGGWLNSLAAPAQVVVTAQPVDLASHADRLAETAQQISDPALAAACADHAAFLAELAQHRDPLRRQVLIVTPAAAGQSGGHAARRRAEDTARALTGLGVTARALDGPAATEALAAAADPYRPPRPGGLATPDTVLSGPPTAAPRAGRKKPPQ